jgi:hypothetical protein
MRISKSAALLLVIAAATAAFASPLFGRWKAELNGQPVSVLIVYSDQRAQGKMAIGTGDNVRYAPLTNIHFIDAPPMTVQFEVENRDAAAKLGAAAGKSVKFELHTTDGNEATLRVVEDGKETAAVKAVKQK